MKLPENSKYLDLGCGPGLYSENFFGKGFDVTGIDFSENSINYAKEQAAVFGYPINYLCKDYLEIDYENEFDVVSLIYGDLCVLSHQDRDKLLKKVYKALQPDGYLIFDVFTKYYLKKRNLISLGILVKKMVFGARKNIFFYSLILNTKMRKFALTSTL